MSQISSCLHSPVPERSGYKDGKTLLRRSQPADQLCSAAGHQHHTSRTCWVRSSRECIDLFQLPHEAKEGQYPDILLEYGHLRFIEPTQLPKRSERRNMAFVCRLTRTHARLTASLSNSLTELRAEQAPGNADCYGGEKSKELQFQSPLQRHFRSLFPGSEELVRLDGAVTVISKSKQRKNNWVWVATRAAVVTINFPLVKIPHFKHENSLIVH